MNRIVAAAFAAVICVVTGCGTRAEAPRADAPGPGDAKPDAAANALAATIIGAIGQTPAAAADAIIRVKQPDQDAETIQVHLWCAADGRVRLEATKLDVEFCSALLRADGSYEAWLPRAKVGSRGKLDQPAADGADGAASGDHAALLAALRLAAAEVREGPLPPAGPFRSGPGAQTLLFPEPGGLSGQAVVDAGERTVTTKRLFDAQGAELVAIAYQRWREFDELKRATIASLSIPGDASSVTVTLRRCDGVGAISDERMRFALPEGAPVVPLREFISRMGE